MYTDELVEFLEDLRANNNKAWFDANRPRYDGLRGRFLDITGQILAASAKFDTDLAGVEPASCVFRINRDVRFSKDKSPYKTTFSAVLTPSKKTNPHGYYYCIDADGSLMIGAGIHMPDTPTLQKIRQAIVKDGKALDDVLKSPKLKSAFGGLDGEQLKTAPRDYPADHPYVDYLRFKSFTIGASRSASGMSEGELACQIGGLFEAASPFVKYLRGVLG
jgi:uncharacterized protein (TIGR02453 family)